MGFFRILFCLFGNDFFIFLQVAKSGNRTQETQFFDGFGNAKIDNVGRSFDIGFSKQLFVFWVE